MPDIREIHDFSIEPADGGPLTRRERQILALLAAGLDQNQIADLLYRSRRTVEVHTQHIKEKLHANTVAQAVSIAWINGWLKARKTLCWLLVCVLLEQIEQPIAVARSSRTARILWRPAPMQRTKA